MKKTKKILCLVLIILIFISVIPFSVNAKTIAETGQCGENVYWSFNSATGQLTIYGTGDMYDYEDNKGTPFFKNSTIKNVVVKEGVTSIGSQAFPYCKNMLSATLPNSLSSINDRAFAECNNLKNVNLSSNIVHLGYEAFYNCDSFTKVILPKSITSMGDYCFYSCDNLKEVVVDGCYLLGKLSFLSCENLEKIIINRGTVIISNSVFARCTKLKEIYLPITIVTIGASTFIGDSSLSDVYYEGSEDMFENLNIGMFNTELKEANIHYGYIFSENHTHSYSETATQPTCTESGIKTFTCECGDTYTETIDATGHKDENGDYKCDYGCGYAFEKPAPDTPSTPDEPENKPCSCNCHKGGISGFFFKIINFFEKLFGKNKVCACGAKH